jgi:hypothetical protein
MILESNGYMTSAIEEDYTVFTFAVNPEDFQAILKQFVKVITQDEIYQHIEIVKEDIDDAFEKVAR